MGKDEQLRGLVELLEPPVYVSKSYIDSKFINFGVSFNDSMVMISTKSCTDCLFTKSLQNTASKFDEYRNLKCPSRRVYNGCDIYEREGVSGSLIKSRIEFGNRSFMLENTLFVSSVFPDHALAKTPVEAVWGFRSPDFDGSYDQSFLR